MVSLQTQFPPSSSSFRREYSVRPAGYRTPSPPLYAIEPISPLPPHAQLEDSTSWVSNKKRKLSNNSNTLFGIQHSLDGSADSLLAPVERKSHPHPRLHKLVAPDSSYAPPSALDVFATVATSPSLDHAPFQQRHLPFANGNTSKFNHPPALPSVAYEPRPGDRVSRRSHSEQIDPRNLPQNNASRPATSHLPQGGWSSSSVNRNLSNGYHRQYDYGHVNNAHHEASLFEAELLLSFARNAQHSPTRQQDRLTHESRQPHDKLDSKYSSFSTPLTSQVDVNRHYPSQSIKPPHAAESIPLPPHQQWDPYKTNHVRRHETQASVQEFNDQQLPPLPQSDDVAPKPRTYKGWPKGKPRGPRNANGDTKRGSKNRGKRKSEKSEGPAKRQGSIASKANIDTVHGLLGSASLMDDTFASIDKTLLKPRRNSIFDFSILKGATEPSIDKELQSERQRSAPPAVSVVQEALQVSKPTKRAPPATPCPACNLVENPANGYNNSWIKCNGCKEWFHAICAGFKTEREIRDVDKYFCKKCETDHGSTTFVRKSSRAHASVDYAGLNEGTVRTAIDVPEHHYIQPIKDGTIEFQPETFPRMKPELVTSTFFERCGNMTEPVLIPACWNPRPPVPGITDTSSVETFEHNYGNNLESDIVHFSEHYAYDCVTDEGQDKLGMVIPQGLTVRRCAELYGPEERVEVIDVKIQEGEDKRWNMRQWADYYEAEGEKPVRNVISLEVSLSRLGRLIKRPQVVRDLDLQDSVWPEEETAKGNYPKVQFYCLMSVADCYTDFHIDFGGSSVYYHIIKGRKTFFFIPPKTKHLKKYEEWCQSSNQNNIFLGNETKECYRVDLYEGDTMLIPSGWIHAVWTPENSLVIGGNFLTRMHYGMQLQINEIEKNTGVARKFRYPHFQKVLWYTLLQYLERDPLPSTVAQKLCEGSTFERAEPIYHQFEADETDDEPEFYNARYYSEPEINGLADLLRYIHRTVLISLGKIPGITKKTQEAVIKSLPKGYGDHLELAKTFAMWIAWKRGNEAIPSWAHPDAVLSETEADRKVSAAALKQADRDAAYQAFKASGDRRPLRPNASDSLNTSTIQSEYDALEDSITTLQPVSSLQQSILGPKRVACEACRKRRIRCKHKLEDESTEAVPQQFGIKQIRPVIPFTPGENSPENTSTFTYPAEGVPSPLTLNADITGATFAGVIIDNSHLSAIPSDGGNFNSKKSRTKACDDCRKSKRRCVHDERGRIDPVKASEPSIPRGPNAAKRARSNSTATADEVKRVKTDPDVDNQATATPQDFMPVPSTPLPPGTVPNGSLPLQSSLALEQMSVAAPLEDWKESAAMYDEVGHDTGKPELSHPQQSINNHLYDGSSPEIQESKPLPSVETNDLQTAGSITSHGGHGLNTSTSKPMLSSIADESLFTTDIGIDHGAENVRHGVDESQTPTEHTNYANDAAEMNTLSTSDFDNAQIMPRLNGSNSAEKTPANHKHPSRERKQVERYSDTKQVETPKFNARTARQKSISSTSSISKKQPATKQNGHIGLTSASRSVSRELFVVPTSSRKSTSPSKPTLNGKLESTSPAAAGGHGLPNSAVSEEPEDESLRLARELQEQEFGLRRRISR